MAQHVISFTLPSDAKLDLALRGLNVADEAIVEMTDEEKEGMIAHHAGGAVQASANNNLSGGVGSPDSNLSITY